MGFDDRFGNGQTQAGPFAGGAACFIRPIKAFENMRQVLRRNPDPVISHSQNCGMIVLPRADAKVAMRIGVTNGVREQIGDHLAMRSGSPITRAGAS